MDYLQGLGDPGLVHFFVWTAYGFGESDGELVRWCNQTYVYLPGSLDDVVAAAASGLAARQTPNMWRPDTGQWAVHSDWRCLCIYVAGPEHLARAILSDSALDALPLGCDDALFTEAGRYPPQ